jgi:hypothetical protein
VETDFYKQWHRRAARFFFYFLTSWMIGKFPTSQTILNWVTQVRTAAATVNMKPPGRHRTVRTPGDLRRLAHAFQRAQMYLTAIGAHLSDIIFEKWLENVMFFHVAYRCLASYGFN